MTPVVAEFTAGVYDGMPEDLYHSDPVPGGSLSSSGARKLLPPSCPARFRWEADNPPPPKDTFELGSAAHKLVLGAGAEIVEIKAENWRKDATKEERDAARAAGFLPLLTAEHEVVKAMAAVLRRHPVASALFNPENGRPEQSLFWQDPETGIMRRARPDWLPDASARGRLIIADYKGLALDTPLPTPDGWTTMGAVQIGDRLLDSAGSPCTVTAKSAVHRRRCYRIRFDDRSEVICDDEHLWVTESGGKQNKTRIGIRTTEQIKDTLRLYGQCHHRVKVAAALDLPVADLPVDPYVFGCWLGDGNTREGKITSADPEIYERITQRGYGLGSVPPSARCPIRTVYGLTAQLRKAGLLGHKAIPSTYLRAGLSQRTDLMCGLMDTDGSWNAIRQQAVFTTIDKALACAVRELACSLGQRAVIHAYAATGFGHRVQAYRVTFTPVGGFNPFTLTRKRTQVAVRSDVKSRQRVVVAVEEAVPVPTQCLTVDSPDSTYLCTEAMIPTHNTTDSANPRAIAKSVENFGYHQQDPWYRDGVRALGLSDDPAFLFVFQEKHPPYLITIAELHPETVRLGRDLNREAIEIYRDCTESGIWPGYEAEAIRAGRPAGIEQISLPPWAFRKYEESR